MKPIVMKFGGTSVGSPDAICRSAQLAADQARKDPGGVVVVVSALSGVTNLLIKGVQQATYSPREQMEQCLQAFYDRHVHLISALHVNPADETNLFIELTGKVAELRKIFSTIQQAGKLEPAQQDAAASLGERMCAPIFAALVRKNGIQAVAVDARLLIVTDDEFTHAAVDYMITREAILARIPSMLAQGIIPVITGFIGATPEGQVTTLGRGASDYTSTILGAALEAREVWNWTDVDGVMAADPRQVPEARVIPVLSYDEMSILSGYGAKVLHPETVRPIAKLSIPLRVRNSFYPDLPGTLVQQSQPGRNGIPLAIGSLSDVVLVEVREKPDVFIPGLPDFQLQPVDGQFQASLAFKIENAIKLDNKKVGLSARITSNVSLVTVIGGATNGARIRAILESYQIDLLAWRVAYADGCISFAIHAEDAAGVVRLLYDNLIADTRPLPITFGVWAKTPKEI